MEVVCLIVKLQGRAGAVFVCGWEFTGLADVDDCCTILWGLHIFRRSFLRRSILLTFLLKVTIVYYNAGGCTKMLKIITMIFHSDGCLIIKIDLKSEIPYRSNTINIIINRIRKV